MQARRWILRVRKRRVHVSAWRLTGGPKRLVIRTVNPPRRRLHSLNASAAAVTRTGPPRPYVPVGFLGLLMQHLHHSKSPVATGLCSIVAPLWLHGRPQRRRTRVLEHPSSDGQAHLAARRSYPEQVHRRSHGGRRAPLILDLRPPPKVARASQPGFMLDSCRTRVHS